MKSLGAFWQWLAKTSCPQALPEVTPPATGLWVGMIVCISLQALSFSAFVMRMDWKKAAEEVRLVLLSSNSEKVLGDFLSQYIATALWEEAKVKGDRSLSYSAGTIWC